MNEVEAVKTASQREQIEILLLTKGQIYIDVWKFGINTALRISDLLAISMDDVPLDRWTGCHAGRAAQPETR